MIFNRHRLLGGVFGHNFRAAGDVAQRWRRAFSAEPELACDLIRRGELLTAQPVEMVNGCPQPPMLDPSRLAYEAGRRDMALLLLALGGISIHDLNQLMESREP